MRSKKDSKNSYLVEVFAKEDSVLKAIRVHAESEGVGHVQVSAFEGGVLQFLCKAFKVNKVLEIGTLFGYSTLMMARCLPPDGVLLTLDISEERQEKAKDLVSADPSSQKIRFLPGKASDSLHTLKDSDLVPFDMIFIDADKSGYLDYLHWANRHLRVGGLLAADNSFLFGAVYGKNKSKQEEKALTVMKEFNKEVATSGLYTGTLIPTEEGLTVGIKNKEWKGK